MELGVPSARGGAEFAEHGFASGGRHGSVHMAGGEAGEMIADAFGAVAREGRGAGDGTVKGKDFADAVLLDGGPERELVGDVARFDGIALHDDFAVAKDMRIHHRGSNHGDDDLVAADDAAPGGFGEGEPVRDR